MGWVIPTFWEQRRSCYSYPSVGLCDEAGKLAHVDFGSTREVDRYHFKLLNSQEASDVKIGYISAVYWGHYAGADGSRNRERAMARAQIAHATDRKQVQAVINATIKALKAGDMDVAVNQLTNLPELGFAFATKICAFLCPQACGVADSVIAERYPVLGFATRNGYITNTVANRRRYKDFCHCLARTAELLNEEDSAWTDRDRRTEPWRAVDVERALFAPTPEGQPG